MMATRQKADLIVVGAGVIGLSVAWRAASAGMSVLVIENRQPGAGASSAAAGALSPGDVSSWEGELGELNVGSMRAWPGFAEELEETSGLKIHYRRSGSLIVACGEGDLDYQGSMKEPLNRFGINYTILSDWRCLDEEPGLKGVMSGMLMPDDAQVDPPRLIAALVAACETLGVEILRGVEPVGSHLSDERVDALTLSDGRKITAGSVVVCCGAWSGLPASWLPAEVTAPDIRPAAGEYLILRGDPKQPVCQRMIRTRYGPIMPREDGTYWIGTSLRDAGYVDEPDPDVLEEIQFRVFMLLPAMRNLEVLGAGVGLRPISANGSPIIGESEVPGLLWATGHGRSGILQAPMTATMVMDLLTR